MSIKHFPLHLGLGLALTIFGVLGGTSNAQAQVGNQSDVTGVIVTTSDFVGGFSPGGDRQNVLAFRTSDIRNAVYTAASSVNQQLAARNLSVPVVANTAPTAIPTTVQQNIECICTRIGDVNACSGQFESGLINAGGDPAIVRNLVSSLQGLTAGGQVDAGRLTAVVRAYNALINASSTAYLSNPPEELRAIQSILSILLNAAYARR